MKNKEHRAKNKDVLALGSNHLCSSLRADLQTHTTASDGTLTPTELVQLARDRDVRVLAVTDHDTIAAHGEAIRDGQACGVRIIRGIEVSALHKQGEVHVLGYGVAPSDDPTREAIEGLREVRVSRAKAILRKLDALGKPVSFERVRHIAGDGMIGRPHISRAMIEAGHVQTFEQAFDEYLGEGKPAFAPNDSLTPSQAIDLIHRAHGCAVLAHPALFKGDFNVLFNDMLNAGLDGIEAFYPLHNTIQTDRYVEITNQFGLIVTGGSDFHGFNGDAEVSLGSVFLPEKTIDALDARIAQYL